MADSFSVLIVEDEVPARELLSEYLKLFPELELSGIARNGEEAYNKLSANKYDLLFLDIHLPVMSGIEVLEKMEGKAPYVIFTTAYDKYAIKAFEFGAIDYLLKPFSKDRFRQSVDRFLAAMKENKNVKQNFRQHSLSFRENRVQCLVAFNDIIYLSSHGKHTVIHAKDKDFESASLLKELESKLPDTRFRRIHKQFVVNIEFIAKLQHDSGGQYIAIFNDPDESTLPVGRSYVASLKEILNL